MEQHENKVQPLPDHPAPDAALIQPWLHLDQRLVPLIGENGFGALFGRTARLVAPRHPWLAVDTSPRTGAALLEALERALAAAPDAASAAAANDALMSTFTRQLGALIGPGLTTRLLAETAIADEKNQEERKE